MIDFQNDFEKSATITVPTIIPGELSGKFLGGVYLLFRRNHTEVMSDTSKALKRWKGLP
jgi:hypothetical protein